jgi:hypothetical protein
MSQPRRRLTRPVETVRAELLADPDTQRIAKAVGMELSAYVELVLDYALNPDKQPVLQVATDEDLREAGYNPPSAEDVAQFFISASQGELGLGAPASYRTGFENGSGAAPTSLRGDENQEPVSVDAETSQKLGQHVPKGGPDRL